MKMFETLNIWIRWLALIDSIKVRFCYCLLNRFLDHGEYTRSGVISEVRQMKENESALHLEVGKYLDVGKS